MRLSTQISEDTRGRRSDTAVLYMHGRVAWPDDLLSGWLQENPGRRVDPPLSFPGGGRGLASLDVLAPDDLGEEKIEAYIDAMRADLSQMPGVWSKRDGVAARFQREERVGPEQQTLLDKLLDSARARLRRRWRWTPIRVVRLELTDFRGVDQLTLGLSLPTQTTVLVGMNGSGKSTVLDTAALLLSHLEAGIRKLPRQARAFTDDDIMNGRDSASIAITAMVGGNPVTWSLSHARGGEPRSVEERSGLFKLDEELAHLHAELDRGDICLPVVVHYPVNRAVLDIPLRIRTQHLFEPLEAYDGALVEGRSNFRLFFEWFRGREDLENETRIHDSLHRDSQLEAVRRAIKSLTPGFSDLRVQRAPLRMVVQKGDWTLYVDQLSDGEKCLLAMAGDLARRLAMANPFADDPLLGGGVVLIDEIDLHLHPGWQRLVVPALEKTFPNCQFLVTTHSPAVLGHVDRDSVFILNPGPTGIRAVRPDFSRGMDANRILEDLLDVPSRPPEFQHKLDELYRVIDAGDSSVARALHTELAATLSASDPALVKAEVLLRRREALPR
ncbi:MAG: AAA family ATPase [Byssovorax sp.]